MKSAAERKRASRARQQKEKARAPDLTINYMRSSFGEFMNDRILELDENLDSLGIELRGTGLVFGEEVQSFRSDGLGDVTMSTLERAEGWAGVFLDAARELHTLINQYKIGEIEARIEEVRSHEHLEPAIRKLALDRLEDIRAALDREFRRSFREIKVAGTMSD